MQRPEDWVKRVEVKDDKVTINGKVVDDQQAERARRILEQEREQQRRIKDAR